MDAIQGHQSPIPEIEVVGSEETTTVLPQEDTDAVGIQTPQGEEMVPVVEGTHDTKTAQVDPVAEGEDKPKVGSSEGETTATVIQQEDSEALAMATPEKETATSGKETDEKTSASGRKRKMIIFEEDFSGLYAKPAQKEEPTPTKKAASVDIREAEGGAAVIIKNLQRPWKEKLLLEKLEACGGVMSRILSNTKKDTAAVLFKDEEGALKAVETLNGTQLGTSDRNLIVQSLELVQFEKFKICPDGLDNKIAAMSVSKSNGKKKTDKTQPPQFPQLDASVPKPEAASTPTEASLTKEADSTKCAIKIENLRRPIQEKELQAHIECGGQIVEDSFRLLNQKSICIVIFTDADQAAQASKYLAEHKFPADSLGKGIESKLITVHEYQRILKKGEENKSSSKVRISYTKPAEMVVTGANAAKESGKRREITYDRSVSPTTKNVPAAKDYPVDSRDDRRRDGHGKHRMEAITARAPRLEGMNTTKAQPHLIWADNRYKMPQDHEGWENHSHQQRHFRRDEHYNRRRSNSRDRR
uniref:RRM domain-containing protein n=1 Tax=Rhabditophanes sp. KR3021 TaxID=114890 RepID=A0AC35UCR4_9BILA